MMSVKARCANCDAVIENGAKRSGKAFCSERCRMIDLGKWLGEEYRIAGPPAGESELAEEMIRRFSSGPSRNGSGDPPDD